MNTINKLSFIKTSSQQKHWEHGMGYLEIQCTLVTKKCPFIPHTVTNQHLLLVKHIIRHQRPSPCPHEAYHLVGDPGINQSITLTKTGKLNSDRHLERNIHSAMRAQDE